MDIELNKNWIKLFGYNTIKNLLSEVLKALNNPTFIKVNNREEAKALSGFFHNIGYVRADGRKFITIRKKYNYNASTTMPYKYIFTREYSIADRNIRKYGLFYRIPKNSKKRNISLLSANQAQQINNNSNKIVEYKNFLIEVNKYLTNEKK